MGELAHGGPPATPNRGRAGLSGGRVSSRPNHRSAIAGPSAHDIPTSAMQPPLDDMEDTKTRKKRGTSDGDSSEFGEVRVISRPAPDAEDRLRRLFTLLLKPSSGGDQAESAKDAPPESRHADDHPEAEA